MHYFFRASALYFGIAHGCMHNFFQASALYFYIAHGCSNILFQALTCGSNRCIHFFISALFTYLRRQTCRNLVIDTIIFSADFIRST